MAFFQKLLNYIVNQVLVEGLANSRTFQRFAIKTDAKLKELRQKGVKCAYNRSPQGGMHQPLVTTTRV